MRAIVLFSGGLDSTTCVAIAHARGFEPVLLSFLYGQSHDTQIHPQSPLRERYGVKLQHVVELPRVNNSSALVDDTVEVPKGRDPRAPGIPSTYVPARNLILLAHAVALAEELGCCDIFIGCSQIDYSGYPDCREGFIRAFTTAANEGTRAGQSADKQIMVHAPLLHWTKGRIIRRGLELGVDYSRTFTCYDPQYTEVSVGDMGYTQTLACGTCDACQLRLEGFREAEVEDPIPYLPDLTLLG